MKKIEFVYLGASGWCTTCRTIKPLFVKEAQRLKELNKDNADISYVCYDIEDDEKVLSLWISIWLRVFLQCSYSPTESLSKR